MNKKISRIVAICMKSIIIFIFVFPFLWMFMTAFKTLPEALMMPPRLLPSKLIWSNFSMAWNAGPFALYTKNTIIINFFIIIIQFIVMVPAAFGFAKYNFKGKNLLFTIVLLAFMIPGQLTFVPVYLMMSKWRLIETLLPQIIPFVSNAFGIFLLRQNFMQIPEEIIESAKIDNAGVITLMLKIMVPMSKPAFVTIALFSFIGHWNSYFWPLVMTRTQNVRPLTIGVAMLRATEGGTNWPVVMAGNLLLITPILIAYIFASKGIVRAFVGTGIK